MFALLVVFSRLGWLHSTGFAWLGQGRTWLILLLPLAYSIVVSTYAMTGNLYFRVADPALTSLAILFIISRS
jgi:hypothetical protein